MFTKHEQLVSSADPNELATGRAMQTLVPDLAAEGIDLPLTVDRWHSLLSLRMESGKTAERVPDPLTATDDQLRTLAYDNAVRAMANQTAPAELFKLRGQVIAAMAAWLAQHEDTIVAKLARKFDKHTANLRTLAAAGITGSTTADTILDMGQPDIVTAWSLFARDDLPHLERLAGIRQVLRVWCEPSANILAPILGGSHDYEPVKAVPPIVFLLDHADHVKLATTADLEHGIEARAERIRALVAQAEADAKAEAEAKAAERTNRVTVGHTNIGRPVYKYI